MRGWIQKAVVCATNVDECLYIIDSVAIKYQGLHIGDKDWAATLMEKMAEKMTEKDAKRFKSKSKKVLSDT
jgi:hypothetical protein